jgi:hypothetical protein
MNRTTSRPHVRITVRRAPGQEPDVMEYGYARVTADPGGDLVIIRKWQRVLRRYRAGEWTGYDVELIPDRGKRT